MKKILILLLCSLVLFTALCEQGAPAPIENAEEIAQGALPLIEILASCPAFYSFEELPEEEFALEAIDAYRLYRAEKAEAETDGTEEEPEAEKGSSEIYALLFDVGENPLPEDFGEAQEAPLPCRAEICGAVSSGGCVRVDFTCEIDYGDGFEFGFNATVYLTVCPESKFGARVCRIFLPE